MLAFSLCRTRNSNTRIWGACSTSCMHQSTIQSIDYTAAHYAFLLYRHWVVTVNVSCPSHGSQTWTIEKFFESGHDFDNHEGQTIEDGTIYISCSSYMNERTTRRTHYFSSPATMADAHGAISSSRNYDFFFRNCKNFARFTYHDIKKLDYNY